MIPCYDMCLLENERKIIMSSMPQSLLLLNPNHICLSYDSVWCGSCYFNLFRTFAKSWHTIKVFYPWLKLLVCARYMDQISITCFHLKIEIVLLDKNVGENYIMQTCIQGF